MEKTIEELHNHVIELASSVENKGIDGQQKLIIAAAMMTVVKSVYLDHFITNSEANIAFEKQLEEALHVNYIKPTIH